MGADADFAGLLAARPSSLLLRTLLPGARSLVARIWVHDTLMLYYLGGMGLIPAREPRVRCLGAHGGMTGGVAGPDHAPAAEVAAVIQATPHDAGVGGS